ncbi:hypothetical protein DWB68_15100 [Galactobacter valiniphilus]|uniref:Uncharacterized protein n=1 Tax=Galactobacter valiniphilus TaxID=2676122 RepID=A0A399J6M9_9MICC|nr:hypothetical protein [Galactobacter valiniphilus]RII40974.1 hypothetical protein DWB68_15100 [Galactobacter valiniphilus]
MTTITLTQVGLQAWDVRGLPGPDVVVTLYGAQAEVEDQVRAMLGATATEATIRLSHAPVTSADRLRWAREVDLIPDEIGDLPTEAIAELLAEARENLGHTVGYARFRHRLI